MKRKYVCALALTMLMLLSILAGCGSSSKSYAADGENSKTDSTVATDNAYPEDLAEVDEGETTTAESSTAGGTSTPFSEKIIYSGTLQVETTTFDEALSTIETLVQQAEGFLENTDISGVPTTNADGSTQVVNRYASYIIRVPCASFQSFLQEVGKIGNVISSNTSATNITSQFTDTEAHLQALKVEEERLLELLKQTNTVDSLIALESRLTDVRYEKEALTRTLKDWQQQVDYSTVNLDLREVASYTSTTGVGRSFGEKVKDAFADGWSGFARIMAAFFVWLVKIMPLLVIFALAGGLFIWIRTQRKKKKAATAQSVEKDNAP